MNIEEKVRLNLLTRGFSNKTLLNNRGLIGAAIDETILELVKKIRIGDVRESEQLVCDCMPDPTCRVEKNKVFCNGCNKERK
jgi:hypothetical protein